MREDVKIETFADFLAKIDNEAHRARTEEVLRWIQQQFPTLKPVIKWNQPMFTNHDTFIIGFSVAKKHLAIAPENVAVVRFSDKIEQAGYDFTKELIRFPWNHPVDFPLLAKIIEFNIMDKADCPTFWR